MRDRTAEWRGDRAVAHRVGSYNGWSAVGRSANSVGAHPVRDRGAEWRGYGAVAHRVGSYKGR